MPVAEGDVGREGQRGHHHPLNSFRAITGEVVQAVCENLNQSSDENYMYYARNYVDFT